jgi:pimeloyl-ACP methyl ester carboxylesterase
MRVLPQCGFWGLVLVSLLLVGCQGAPEGTSAGQANTTASNNAANAAPAGAAEHRVVIDSADGLKLVGTYYAPDRGNSPAVLLLHQWESGRHSYDNFAKRLQGLGYAVLSIDGRGFGESTRAADGMKVPADRSDAAVKAMLGDVGAAFEYLGKQPDVDAARMSIIGASYGSSLALIYAADHTNVKAVVLLSPGLNYFGNMQTEPAVKKYGDRPLLLVAAADDAESADAVKALKAASPKAEEKVYEKGGHGTALLQGGLGLEQVIETFLTNVCGCEAPAPAGT